MNDRSRTVNSLLNSSIGLIMRGLHLVVSFISRSIFIQILGINYLGINAVFANVLTMLSLAELGINSALMYGLYSKIASSDKKGISALLHYYKKLYRIIGTIIFILGLLLIPFIKYMNGIDNIDQNIYIIYLLFLFNSVCTYFFSYKNIMLEADQRKYIVTTVQYIVFMIANLTQIIFLYLTQNYYIYLIITILYNVLGNVILIHLVNKRYSFINKYRDAKLTLSEKKSLFKDSKALFIHRISGFIVFGTDNLLIAFFVNLKSVGLYDNYYMIINNVSLIAKEVINAFRSSIGNLVATVKVEDAYNIFLVLQYLCFFIFSFAATCLFIFINPFISIWLGKEYLLSNYLITILLINFYITGMRTIVLLFKDANGFFSQDVKKAVAEALLNLVLSLSLAPNFGILGVFLGTLLSSLITSFWVEPYIVFKLYFKMNILVYWIQYIKQILLLLLLGYISYTFFNWIIDFSNFFVAAIPTMVIYILLFVLLTYKQREFKFIFTRMKFLITQKFGGKNGK